MQFVFVFKGEPGATEEADMNMDVEMELDEPSHEPPLPPPPRVSQLLVHVIIDPPGKRLGHKCLKIQKDCDYPCSRKSCMMLLMISV